MKIIYSIIILLSCLLVSPLNLGNLAPFGILLESKSDNYIKLTKEANQTFYQLFGIELDFKDRYFIEIEDESKFLRVTINESKTAKNEEFHTFEFENDKTVSEVIPENISITLFGRTYNLKDEFYTMLNSIFRSTNVTKITFPKENFNTFDTVSKYELSVKNDIGIIDVIVEDKDDKIALEEDLKIFWDNTKDFIQKEYINYTRVAAEFVAITLSFRRVAPHRYEKLVKIANKTFYDLYNISLDFQGKYMIISNEESRYYKVLINEYPKYEGETFTKISIKNGRVFYTDFPIFSSLTFKIFGRTFNLKEEFLSISYLIAPIIKDGYFRIEKMNLDEFDSQIINKYELIRENEESQGGYEIIFEDKDDIREIKQTLNEFWQTWSNKIPEKDIKDAKLIAQFVVTTFGIWHSIPKRYDKIVDVAKLSLYQLLNITINFNNRYIFHGKNNVYELLVVIDEYPIEITDIGTYINITDGRPYFPEITEKPYSEVKLKIGEELLDVDEEYKNIGNILASGIRNGKIIIYKKDTQAVSNIIRLKCFIKSQNNEGYGAFEISIKYIEKNTWQIISDSISTFWKEVKEAISELNEGLKLVSETAAIVKKIVNTTMEILPNKSFSSYLIINIPLTILSYLLF